MNTTQKVKFYTKDFFSKYDQIHRKLRIWSHAVHKLVPTSNFLIPSEMRIYQKHYCKSSAQNIVLLRYCQPHGNNYIFCTLFATSQLVPKWSDNIFSFSVSIFNSFFSIKKNAKFSHIYDSLKKRCKPHFLFKPVGSNRTLGLLYHAMFRLLVRCL